MLRFLNDPPFFPVTKNAAVHNGMVIGKGFSGGEIEKRNQSAPASE